MVTEKARVAMATKEVVVVGKPVREGAGSEAGVVRGKGKRVLWLDRQSEAVLDIFVIALFSFFMCSL